MLDKFTDFLGFYEKNGIFKRIFPYIAIIFLGVFLFPLTYGNVKYIGTLDVVILCLTIAIAVNLYFLYKSKDVSDKISKIFTIVIVTFYLGIICLSLCTVLNKQKYSNAITLIGFLAISIIVFYLFINIIYDKITTDKIIFLIIFAGFVLRFLYVLYTGIKTRQHDLYVSGKIGHYYYVKYIFTNNKLPDFDVTNTQMYHPPFHHLICALLLKVFCAFGVEYDVAYEGLQCITAVYSTLVIVFTYKTLKLLDLDGLSLVIPCAIIAFMPALIIMGGSLNNDMLSVTLSVSAIYFSLKWYKDQKLKNIIPIALSIGLGMFTKLSVWMVAPGVAILFLFAMFKNLDKFKKYLLQYCIFAVICVPVALYWSIRNYVKYDVPLGYVILLSNKASQYVGNYPEAGQVAHTAIDRLFNFSLYQFKSVFDCFVMYGDSYNEFNPTIALFKTAMFDEGTFTQINGLCNILFWSGTLIALLSVGFTIFGAIKNYKNNSTTTLSLLITTLTVTVSYYVFCLIYAHVCTQNCRYVMPSVFINSLFIGISFKYIEQFKNKNLAKIIKYSLLAITIIFCLSSVSVYVSIPLF